MKDKKVISEATIDDRLLWDKLANHPLQSWAWGDFRKAMGITLSRNVITSNTKPVECWQMTFHPVPYTPFKIGYFPKGPNPDDFMIGELLKIGKINKSIYLQLEPDIKITHNPSSVIQNQLIPSHHPLFTKYTFVLDLLKNEDELLKSMSSKTRYNIKVANKHNVSVTEDNSSENFDKYIKLLRETTGRQGFYAHNEIYQRKMWQIMSKNGIASLWTAKYNNQILSAWIIFKWKDTVYYPYGASSREYRNVMAPTLLLWEITKYYKSQGYKKFDLWGALGPNPDINDPWYGFHRFKEGFGPDLVEYEGSYDLPVNNLLYKIFTEANSLRWKILKNLKK